MKILMVTQDYFPSHGGIQSYCHQLAVNLVAKGCVLTMICPGKPEEEDAQLPFEVLRLDVGSSFLFLKLFGFLKAHMDSQETPYDHVIMAQWQNAIPFLFSKPTSKTKLHTMVHGRELLHGVFGFLTPWFSTKVYKLFDSVVPNSNPIAQMFRRQNPYFSAVHVIHPGVDSERFTPQNTEALKKELGLEGKVLLTSITRLVARKNIGLVVEAMPLVLEKIPQAHFVVGGRGPELENIKGKVKELKLEHCVSVLGGIPEERLVEYFSLGDVFLLPSSESKTDVEGFGIVFLEAGACEVPVIGANTGGIQDAVVHTKTGILLEKITKETLAEAIVEVTGREDRGKALGVASRQRIQNELTWAHCAQNYLDKVFR